MSVGDRAMAMLCAKAWHESRGRFWISALVVAGACAGLILLEAMFRARMAAAGAPAVGYAGYVYSRIYGGVVRAIFVILVILLGLGGLQRERAQRTIGFSLALPVRRTQHVVARIVVGLAEIAVLAALPVVLVPVCSAAVGESYGWTRCASFAVLWFAVGGAMFAASVLVSAAVRSDYAALAVAILGLRIVPLMLPVKPDQLMSGRGMAYFDPAAGRLVGGVPWLVVVGAAGVAAVLFAIAARVTERERFGS